MASIAVSQVNSTTCTLQVIGLDESYQYYRDYDWQVVDELYGQTVATNLQQTAPGVKTSPVWQVSGLRTGVLHSVTCNITRSDAAISLSTLTTEFVLTENEGGGGSGGGNEEEEIEYGWSRLGSEKTQSFSLSFELDDYKVGYIYFTPPTNGTINVYTKGNYDMYGWLFYKDGSSLVDGATGSSTIEGNYLKRNNDSGTGNNFSYSYSSAKANTTYEIDIHEYNVGYCRGTLYVDFTPAVTNYTITYALGTANQWSDKTTANKTQNKPSNSSITLSDITAIKNSSTGGTGYVVTFNGNDATSLTKKSQTSGKTTNYTHNGWSTSSDGTKSYDLKQTYSNNGDITLYPTFLTYYTYSNVKLPNEEQCTRTGYTLLGWSNSSTATEMSYAPGAEYSGAETTTLYAVWQADTYTITLNLNDGSEEIVHEYTVESLPIVAAQSRTGYTFLGWTGSNGTTPQQTVTISANDLGNKSYTANWQANTYTYNISCVSKSGKSLQTQNVDGVFDTTNLITPPEIDGYTKPSAQNVVWDSVTAKQIEFVYEPIEYKLSINYDNGTPYISDTYTIESAERELKSQSRNGYAFCGWTGTEITSPQETVIISSGSIGERSYVATWAPLIVFNFKKSDTDLLKNLTNTQGIAINWYVSESQIQDFINKINNYCNTTIVLSEWQTLDNYNAIVDALNNSSDPAHFSDTTKPNLAKKSKDDYIKAQDLLDLENAFNNRKFI